MGKPPRRCACRDTAARILLVAADGVSYDAKRGEAGQASSASSLTSAPFHPCSACADCV